MFRVVCVKPFEKIYYGSNNPAIGNYKWPVVGEIYTVECVRSNGCYIIVELSDFVGYDPSKFRPIDEQFGERIASEIEEEINQEELVKL